VALALSGGGDSMALLRIASDWARLRGRRLVAITVDHGLNPDSPAWSRLCQDAAREAGADWIERRWEATKPATGLTAAARAARHGLIAEAAREVGARVVLFAHTADDIAESDWMRGQPMGEGGSTLGRLREWSPSPAWPEGRGLMLLRPMLDARRDDLRAWLREHGQVWIEDPANADERFGRSRARARLADGSRSEDGERPDPSSISGRCSFSGAEPLSLGEGFAVARSVRATELAAVLLCASGRSEPVRRDRLERLAQRLSGGEVFTAALSGARIEAGRDRIIIGREAGEFRRRPVAEVALEPGVAAVWDNRFEIMTAEPGWTVGAAAGRLNRLSPADRAILKPVPEAMRAALPVLIRDGGGDPLLAGRPVLAWRKAEVRALAPRRLALFLDASTGETTQEADLERTIHGEMPPPDLFSHD